AQRRDRQRSHGLCDKWKGRKAREREEPTRERHVNEVIPRDRKILRYFRSGLRKVAQQSPQARAMDPKHAAQEQYQVRETQEKEHFSEGDFPDDKRRQARFRGNRFYLKTLSFFKDFLEFVFVR